LCEISVILDSNIDSRSMSSMWLLLEFIFEIITSTDTSMDPIKRKQMINTLLDLVPEKKLAKILVTAMNLARILKALTEQLPGFSCENVYKKLRTMSSLEFRAHAWIHSTISCS
jgi:hypothetical protein